MSAELNHTIVHSRDREEAAGFIAGILGLEVGQAWGPFLPVETGNGVTLDYATSAESAIAMQHYAFLVPDAEFDEIFERLRQTGVTYYADPMMKSPGEINHHDGGSGVYFLDPSGHGMEIITRPYGSGSDGA